MKQLLFIIILFIFIIPHKIAAQSLEAMTGTERLLASIQIFKPIGE